MTANNMNWETVVRSDYAAVKAAESMIFNVFDSIPNTEPELLSYSDLYQLLNNETLNAIPVKCIEFHVSFLHKHRQTDKD